MDVLLGQDLPQPGVAVGVRTVDVQPEVAETGAVLPDVESSPRLEVGAVGQLELHQLRSESLRHESFQMLLLSEAGIVQCT